MAWQKPLGMFACRIANSNGYWLDWKRLLFCSFKYGWNRNTKVAVGPFSAALILVKGAAYDRQLSAILDGFFAAETTKPRQAGLCV